MINLVVGLGNPGKEYENNRHNLGYKVIEKLARRKRKDFKAGKGDYYYCQIESNREEIFLIKPHTFMNICGWVVLDCLADFNMIPENLLILCDDINLPLGKIRIRESGTDGGHKGLRSIIYQLNTLDFARLRMGVGVPEEEQDVERFVLEDFKKDELDTVNEMINQAADATEGILSLGIKKAMNKYN